MAIGLDSESFSEISETSTAHSTVLPVTEDLNKLFARDLNHDFTEDFGEGASGFTCVRGGVM